MSSGMPLPNACRKRSVREHGVARGLRRQADEQAAVSERCLQTQMGQQRQFCLSLSHRRFDDQQFRARGAFDQATCCGLQWARREPGLPDDASHEHIDAFIGLQQRAVGRPSDGPKCGIGQGQRPLTMACKCRVALAWREPLGIRGDPVTHRGQSGQPGQRRQGDVVVAACGSGHNCRDIRVEQLPACVLPSGTFSRPTSMGDGAGLEEVAMVGCNGASHSC